MCETRKSLGDSIPSLWWQYRMKHQYHFTPWDQWESLDEVISNPIFHGIYEINKNLEVRNIRTGKVWRAGEYSLDDGGYENINLTNGRENKGNIPLHIASTGKFLFNPEPKVRTQIDHINRNKLDNSLVNTVFSTPEENVKNRTLGISDRYALEVYSKYDIYRENCLANIYYSDFDTKGLKTYRTKIMTSMKKKGEFNGLVYIKVDLLLKEYLKFAGPIIERDFNPLFPELGGWILHSDEKDIWVNSNGTHKIGENGIPTVGTPHGLYLRSCINGRGILDSNLVYTAFKGKIPEGLEICHEDGNARNNNITNLVARTHTENMQNEFTRERLGRRVIMIDPATFLKEKEYKTAVEASEDTGVCISSILKVCNGSQRIAGNKLWSFKGEEERKIDEFKKSRFDFQKYLHSQRTYTIEEAKKIAKNYSCRWRLQLGNNKAYNILYDNNLLDEVFPPEDILCWDNKEYVKSIASQYSTYSKLCSGSYRAVKAIERNNWDIKEFYPKYYKQNRK